MYGSIAVAFLDVAEVLFHVDTFAYARTMQGLKFNLFILLVGQDFIIVVSTHEAHDMHLVYTPE